MVAATLARGRFEGKQLAGVKDILVCDAWAGDGGSGAGLAWGRGGFYSFGAGVLLSPLRSRPSGIVSISGAQVHPVQKRMVYGVRLEK
jgi:hypothetical protein